MSAGCTHMTRERTWRGLRHLGRKACCIGAVVSLATGPRLVRCSARLHYGNRGCSRSTRYVESSRSTRAGGPSLSLWSIATALTPLSRLKTPPTSQQSASLSADSAPLAHQSLKAAVRSWWHWPLDSVFYATQAFCGAAFCVAVRSDAVVVSRGASHDQIAFFLHFPL